MRLKAPSNTWGSIGRTDVPACESLLPPVRAWQCASQGPSPSPDAGLAGLYESDGLTSGWTSEPAPPAGSSDRSDSSRRPAALPSPTNSEKSGPVVTLYRCRPAQLLPCRPALTNIPHRHSQPPTPPIALPSRTIYPIISHSHPPAPCAHLQFLPSSLSPPPPPPLSIY